MAKKESTRITLSNEAIWHLYLTMEGILDAGSELRKDCEVTIELGKAMQRAGFLKDVARWERYLKEVDWPEDEEAQEDAGPEEV